MAGIAVAAVAVVAIGGVVQQLRPEPYAAPASPSASVSPIPADEVVAADGTILDKGEGITLCVGGVEVSRPPRCNDSIPVSGITWDDLDWESTVDGTSRADVVLVGTFDQTSFAATDVYIPRSSEAPPRPTEPDTTHFEPLCTDPVQGYGTGSSEDELSSILQELPGFQTEWPSLDQDFTNIAVTGDVKRAREIIEVSWSGPFCVGTLAGPTHAVMEAADEALSKFEEDGRRLSFFGPMVTQQTHRLHIAALLATPAVLSELEQVVGPEVWPFTTVSSFFYPVETSTTPDPSNSAFDNAVLVAAKDTLIDKGDGMTLCNGSVLESRPPGCPFPTPVTGVTWDDVPGSETADGITFAVVVIVGTFDGNGDVFSATQVFRDDDPAAPTPPETITDEDLPTLCDAPTRGTGPDSIEDLIVAAENLPGYQALWVSPNQVTYNVAVTSDVESARSALTEIFGGELCVGIVDGPTERGLQDAELALEPLKPDIHDPTATNSIWNTFSSVSTLGNRLEVSVRRDTPELLDKMQAAVGREVWPHTDIIPFFYPVEGSATQDSTPSATSPGRTGTTTTSAFTDEQRGWAEGLVGDVLGSVGEPGQPAVTAKMAKVTYGQYLSVWNIDIPEPPGPTPDDAEILVVALSASLDSSSIRGGPPSLTTPDPTASQTHQELIGTVIVLDPSTGENLSHVTILGGDPPADLIMNLPGPIEDVVLPRGFR